MAALVAQFITHTASIFAARNAQNLVASLPISSSHPFWNPLKEALSSIPPNQITPDVIISSLGSLPEASRDAFGALLYAVLQAIRGGNERLEEERAYGDFKRLQSVYTEANRLYTMSAADGPHLHPFLNPLILELARRLVALSSTAAALSTAEARDARSSRSIRDLTRQTIERSTQVSTSNVSSAEWVEMANDEHVVGDNLWPLANILWRIYGERRLHQQSLDLARSIEQMQPSEDKRINARSYAIQQTDLCQSYYWRGRAFLILLEYRTSKRWLDRAWDMCPIDAYDQRRTILMRLIAVNLLVGIMPTQSTLEMYDLGIFRPLLQAYMSGNVPAWRRELDANREWLRRRHIWLLLFERGETIVWRNLFRRSLESYYALNPSATRNRCPTWVFLSSVSKIFEGTGYVEDGTVTLEYIISMISSLIDHRLILGVLSYSQKVLAMKEAPDGFGGFPKVSEVLPRAVVANA